jgi:glycosyltransferase involved in cell wall biosynthesis
VRIVIDGLPIRTGSIAVVTEQLLCAWPSDVADELHLVIGTDSGIVAPPNVVVHEIDLGRRRSLRRLRAQLRLLPQLCRRVHADVLLAAVPATTPSRLPCARVVIAHDLRHEIRPEQFSTGARVIRRVSHGLGFRQADAIITVSQRTRNDLLASRPWLADRIVRPAELGGDHVDTWPRPAPGPPYAIAFGQWGNKNVDLTVDAWRLLSDRDDPLPLFIVGLAESASEELRRKIDAAGLNELIHLLPWLSDEEFRARFASASIVVFPSDFEGFGLPAVEAMRLGIPLVISPDRALLEVTDGHAAIMHALTADALAAAVITARAATPSSLAAARLRAAEFTWARMAGRVRATLLDAVEASRTRARPTRRRSRVRV